jgi:DNA-binding NarL/FixJ family response regulator
MTKKKNIKTEPTTVWLYRSFSEREIEVLRLSVKGFSNEEIAKNLHRSIHAIK